MHRPAHSSPEEPKNGRAPRGADPHFTVPKDHHLGTVDHGRPGPLLLAIGGLHGNEPSGVTAIERVLSRIAASDLSLRGRLVGLAGNLQALEHGERFIDRDLNRMWSSEELDLVHRTSSDDDDGPEARARRALLVIIEGELERHGPASEPVKLLDLHSTSANGAPFSIIGDTLCNRRIARAMPCPLILGLEELVDGALLGYFSERGHVAVGFEGGQHRQPDTIDNSEAALWLALIAAGCLAEDDVAEIAREMRARLSHASAGTPRAVEVRLCYTVEPEARFEMRPGYANFDRVRRGEWLASSGDARIEAEFDGRLLMPRYQGQGEHGFFLGRRVNRFWLALSRLLRHLRLERLLPLVPGVVRTGERNRLRVDPRVVRFFPVKIFHLFGYRRVRPDGDKLAFSRRVERPLRDARPAAARSRQA